MICDICIIVTAQFTLSYYLLIERTIHISSTSYIDIFVQLTYPMTDLLFFLIGINLLFKPLSLLSKRLAHFLGAFTFICYYRCDLCLYQILHTRVFYVYSYSSLSSNFSTSSNRMYYPYKRT